MLDVALVWQEIPDAHWQSLYAGRCTGLTRSSRRTLAVTLALASTSRNCSMCCMFERLPGPPLRATACANSFLQKRRSAVQAGTEAPDTRSRLDASSLVGLVGFRCTMSWRRQLAHGQRKGSRQVFEMSARRRLACRRRCWSGKKFQTHLGSHSCACQLFQELQHMLDI